MLPHCNFFVVAAVILSAVLAPVLSARSDLVALYGLRASLDVRAQDWPLNSNPCAWTGVTCSAGRVVSLRLAGLRRTHRGKLRASFAVDALQDLTALEEFDASGFPLPGRIPAWFGRGLPPSLAVVDLRSAAIDGTLPADIGMSGNLKNLVLAGNSLSGRIPASLLSAKGLKLLDLSNNNLTGELPSISSHVGDGIMDGLFNVSGNSLYGAFRNSLGSLKKRFRVVDVSSNYFDSVVGVGAANGSDGTVDVKMNCLSGVPNQRSRSDCEVFYNRLVKVPAPSSPSPGKRREKWKYVLAGVLAASAILVVLVLVALVFCLMRIGRRPGGRGLEQNEEGMLSGRRRDSSVNPVIWPPMSVSLTANAAAKGPASFMDQFTYEQLLHATAGFGDDNLVKHGHAGDIYRGVLESGFHVVVKKIDVKSSKKDMSELGFLAKKFHGRIVPLLGHLTKDEEELLVYKYMPKGDLTTALHKKLVDTEEGLPSLDWITRLKIAIGVAEALCFLHDECSPPLVHRDIQASSVLLDDKFEVRLGSLSEICTQESAGNQNFLSRMLRSSKSLDKNTSGRPASSSYDVYCFGKVLLELITGDFGVSSSNDEVSEQWLANKLGHISVCDKESISNIVDPSLIVDDDHLEEVWAVSIVAKACLNSKPSRRPLARYILMALESPLRVVREDFRSNSARLRSTSSRSSWHSAFHGNSYRSSAIMPMSGKILVRKNSAKSQGSSGGENSLSFKRASREIVPEPLELEDNAIVLDHPTH